ncbi:alpha/beta hydrolase [Kineosporia sp. NBRC 101677]|uniref:alpha/beta fold hydrolase n=1 Tax=Kineosporia sp. NBRC 101677 TaxID=3032197 RepID=UPI0024A065E3|nr:alpha/beta hydrolase [Kineosporia sp. NBRC 101677]GLY19652.1 alpha/beta hydrolase [Kineosporia sp. NBRC 101677]
MSKPQRPLLVLAAVAALSGAATAVPATAQASTSAKPTVVLVHGAWADASSFAPVTQRLQHDGYQVLNAPNPLRGLAADAASVAAFVNQATEGPVVLVGHSYGGAVITNAATQAPRVRALAYIDAFAPAAGETIVQLTGAKPGSALAAPVETVFDVVQDPAMPAGDVDLYVKRSRFREIFAAHLPAKSAKALAAAQSPIAAGALQEPSGEPAWKTLPSEFVVGTGDRVIPAAEQLAMAQRAHGHVTQVSADHLSMLQKPAVVTAAIERAARR